MPSITLFYSLFAIAYTILVEKLRCRTRMDQGSFERGFENFPSQNGWICYLMMIPMLLETGSQRCSMVMASAASVTI